jgi:hypothetical protein
MIVYVATSGNLYTLLEFIEDNPERLRRRIKLVPYKKLFDQPSLPKATYIFSDLERLTISGLHRTASIWKQLQASDPAIGLYNDPLRVKRRYELLRHLHARGINSFNVRRAADVVSGSRFPVFLRRESDHFGPTSALIENEEDLQAAIDGLATRGAFRDDHIVTEFCGAPDDTGAYVKYGCFRVGDRILPQNRLVGRQWCVKNFEYFDETVVARDLAYIKSTEHNETVRKVFDIAAVDYGRVDYAIVNGRLEFYELNTNPHNSYREMDAIPESRDYFTPRFIDALLALDCPADWKERVKIAPPEVTAP